MLNGGIRIRSLGFGAFTLQRLYLSTIQKEDLVKQKAKP
jgi:hypothetical protein